MGSAGDWCLIESDPGVFTALVKEFGVKGAQVEELWGLADEAFENLRPMHGLIFLFKWADDQEPDGPIVQDERLDKIYFAKQVINNACATQAIVSILLNCNDRDIILGPELTKLKEFSMSFDIKMRGLALSNSQTIRAAHNSMAQQTLFAFDPKMATQDNDAYHFVVYMPINGRVYELDGLRDGPIDLGPLAPDQDWIEIVKPLITTRMRRYIDGEIHFNLMAVVTDRKLIYEERLSELINYPDVMGMDTQEIEEEIEKVRILLDDEDIKFARYRREMARRKHNYLPFIMELLKILAEQKKLMPLYEKAKQRASERTNKKMKI